MQTIRCPGCGRDRRYVSTVEFAAKIGRSVSRVKQFLQAGRIEGAIKVGLREYLIPDGAEDELVILPSAGPRGFRKRRRRR